MTNAVLINDFAHHMQTEAKIKGYDHNTIVYGLLAYLAAYTSKMSEAGRKEVLDALDVLEQATRLELQNKGALI